MIIYHVEVRQKKRKCSNQKCKKDVISNGQQELKSFWGACVFTLQIENKQKFLFQKKGNNTTRI